MGYGSLGHAAVREEMCVENLAAQERCNCWNVPYSDEDTPIMWALREDKTDIVERGRERYKNTNPTPISPRAEL